MTPEQQARRRIDDLLQLAGWEVQNRRDLNPSAGRGIAIREFSTLAGPADYLLLVDRKIVGVVEAKKVGDTLTGVETQSAKYREGLPSGLSTARLPLPFAYETTGIETRFTSFLDPDPRSRPVFAFHRPETLADWLTQAPPDPNVPNAENDTLRARLRRMPPLATEGLRDCQVEAITNLERSFALDRPRALIQMATGSGKTFTAVGSVYRLLKYAGARRVLFLVDRATLGKQAANEFAEYTVPGDGRKFTELYNVQHLQTNSIDPVANVCITTIQRLYSMLSGQPTFDPAAEEASLFDLGGALSDDSQPPREVQYNPAIPIEEFDVIITDECHRSIYNLWRGVLEYFDSFIVGLTATPNKHTFAFFHGNLVMEYGHDRAVADGVNVDYDVYRIRTALTERGGEMAEGDWVDVRNKRTRAIRWQQLDEDVVYPPEWLDHRVVAPDQIRTIIRAFRDALPTTLFPGRSEVPKTLIFAKDDSHADDIVQIVREEFGRGNEFCQKITYRTTGAKPEDLIASFRNSYYPRVAVTVDMISTGTDIKPLEVLLFMRLVKSRGFFEQMKGRGTRTIPDTDFQAVTPDARSKDHFVLVDAVGVTELIKTDEPPLDRKRSVALDKLLEAVVMGVRDEDTLSSLAARLGRLASRLQPQDEATLAQLAGGRTVRDLARGLVEALDPDVQLEAARAATGQDDPDEAAIEAAAQRLVAEAAAPFDQPALRHALADAQRRSDQLIDPAPDTPLQATVTQDRAQQEVESFRQYLDQHRDEITALQVLYSRPRHAGPPSLRFSDIKQLAEAIQTPPLGLTADRLWQAYAQLDCDRVRGVGRQRLLTDLVSLVRYAVDRDRDPAAMLEPYAVGINRRFEVWLADQERRQGQPFTAEQRQWLEMMRDQVASALAIDQDAFEYEPFIQRGGLGRAYQLFGDDLPAILTDLNERLAA